MSTISPEEKRARELAAEAIEENAPRYYGQPGSQVEAQGGIAHTVDTLWPYYLKSASGPRTAETDDHARRIRVAAIKTMAKGICQNFGPKPGCFCGQSDRKCHATILYHDFAMYALLALEKNGFAVLKLPEIDFTEEPPAVPSFVDPPQELDFSGEPLDPGEVRDDPEGEFERKVMGEEIDPVLMESDEEEAR